MTNKLRQEIQLASEESEYLIPNATHLVQQLPSGEKSATFVEKDNILEMEILSDKIQAKFPTFASLQKDTTLIECFQEHMPQLGIKSQALKGYSTLTCINE